MLRLARLMILAGAAAAITISGAQAQSCFVLQAELMQLMSQGQGRLGGYGRYDRAYQEQANLLDRTERQARQAGCFGGFFLFRRENSRACRVLVPRLREMQENLVRLDRARRQSGGGDSRRLQEVRNLMRARGCDQGGGFLRALPHLLWEDDSLYSARGTYRTLCVRTCDGYYFPISFSTVEDQFTADAQACQAMCPGAQSELYYYPNPGGGPESMLSITGTSYSSLPTAFQYRKRYDASCTCRPSEGLAAAIARSTPGQPVPIVDKTAPAPLPRARPAPGEDPETLANRAGYFVPRVGSEADDGAATVAGVDGQPVRVVGPVYWGAPQHDDVVITPVPN